MKIFSFFKTNNNLPAPVVPQNKSKTVEPSDVGLPKFIEPKIGSALVPRDVKDIFSLFNYLVSRTDRRTADYVPLAIGEMDFFIKNNMIDLRNEPGLICTDGVYLLQEGTESTKHRFLLLRMNNIQCIQSDIIESKIDLFKDALDKKAIQYLKKMDKNEKHSFVFEKFARLDPVVNARLFFRYVRYRNKWFDNTTKDDDSYSVRRWMNYDITCSIRSLLAKEMEEAREMFGKKNLAFVAGGKLYWYYDNDILCIDDIYSYIENEKQKDNRYIYFFDDSQKAAIEYLRNNKNKITKSDDIPYHSNLFDINIVAF